MSEETAAEVKEFFSLLRDVAAWVDEMDRTAISRHARTFEQRDGKIIFRSPNRYTAKNGR